jgi:acetylornithine deacetylase
MRVGELLERLVRINSVNAFYAGGPGEAECAAAVASFWKENGIEHQVSEVLPDRPNVIAKIRGRNAMRTLVLEAHLDTVSVDGMTIPPFEPQIANGRLYGRGSCDTKAGLAGMMLALQRTCTEGITPECNIIMAAVIDEECSCHGIRHFCNGLSADGAIVAEPTELRLVVASKGVLRWRIFAKGRAAHSSKKELGINAIHHMAKLVVTLESYHREMETRFHPLLGPATASIGLIHGGVQINIVPDLCVIEIDRRVLPGENPQEILEGYRQLLRSLEAQLPDASFELEPPMLSEPCLDTDPDSPVACCARSVLRKLGLNEAPCGVSFGSDASKLQESGVASIIFGPGSIDRAHTANEFVELDQVEQAHEFYYTMIQEFS